jgi:DNA-binding CsgD family transcriptional regulator
VTNNEQQKIHVFFNNLDSILATSPHAAAVWDREGHFVRANQGYIALFHGEPPRNYSIWDDPIILATDQAEKYLVTKKTGGPAQFSPIRYNTHDLNPAFPDNPIVFETAVYPVFDRDDRLCAYLFRYIDRTRDFLLEEKIASLEKMVKPLLDKHSTGNDLRTIISSRYELSAVESMVCELIFRGLSGKEIALEMGLSFATIHSHSVSIRKKLGLCGSKERLFTVLARIASAER